MTKLFFIALLLLAPNATQAAERPIPPQMPELAKKMNEAETHALAHLPPCEGMAHFSSAALSYEAPKSCEKAQELLSYARGFDRALTDACRDSSGWLEAELRDPQFCDDPAAENQKSRIALAGERLTGERKALMPLLDNDPFTRKNNQITEHDPEFERPDCATTLLQVLQFRKKQLSLINRHFSHAETGLSYACGSDREQTNEYLDFLHHGESAFRHKK